jgi:hypothetical protein
MEERKLGERFISQGRTRSRGSEGEEEENRKKAEEEGGRKALCQEMSQHWDKLLCFVLVDWAAESSVPQ